VSATIERRAQVLIHPIHAIHPFHAVMLAATVPLFLGALLSDWAYWSSHEIQWANFSSWLIAGALVFGAVALLCAVIGLVRRGGRSGPRLLYLLLLLATWVLGFINALIHAKDAWAVMPTGLILSLIVAVLAIVTTWIGFSTLREGGRP
jgi:uncharacterized membrane protein